MNKGYKGNNGISKPQVIELIVAEVAKIQSGGLDLSTYAKKSEVSTQISNAIKNFLTEEEIRTIIETVLRETEVEGNIDEEAIREIVNTSLSQLNIPTKTETDEKINNLSNQLELNPDKYEGDDLSKLQQALQYLIDNEATYTTIRLNRMYDITGGSLYINSKTFWKYIYIEGGGIIKNDSGYIIDSLGEGRDRNCPMFTRCKFTTTASDVYLCNGDKFIRQNVDRCQFKMVGLVKSSDYIQSIRVHNCEIAKLGCDFINAKTAYDTEITHNRFEQNNNPDAVAIRIQKEGVSFLGLRIISNLIEGYTYNSPIVLSSGSALDISSNYFEGNLTSIHLERPGDASNSSLYSKSISGYIRDNIFTGNKNQYDIKIAGTLVTDYLMVVSNTSDQLVKNYLCNEKIVPDFDNSNYMSAGGSYHPTAIAEHVRKNTYKTTQLDNGSLGCEFRIPLNLKNNGTLWNQESKQFLCNIRFTYGDSLWCSGHLTLLMSIDGVYKDGVVKQFLTAEVLSAKGTSGNVDENLNDSPVFDYYFSATRNKEIDSEVDKATIGIRLPNIKYDKIYNVCNFKSLDSLMSEFYEDTGN